MTDPSKTPEPQQAPNPYAPPIAGAEGFVPQGREDLQHRGFDDLLSQTKLRPAVKAAVWMVCITGVLKLLGALQLWAATRLGGAIQIVPVAMLVVGVFSIVLGVKIYRQRVWAVVTALVLEAITVPAMGLWFLLASASGFISLIAFLIPLFGVLAAVFAGIAIGPCRRTAAVRTHLKDDGMNIDF